MTYSEEELRDMVLRYRRGEDVRCGCGGRLHVNGMETLKTKAVPTEFTCRRCGRSGAFTPERAKEPWTESEKAEIRDSYLRDLEARCPRDGAVLTIKSVATRRGHGLIVRCKYCGEGF